MSQHRGGNIGQLERKKLVTIKSIFTQFLILVSYTIFREEKLTYCTGTLTVELTTYKIEFLTVITISPCKSLCYYLESKSSLLPVFIVLSESYIESKCLQTSPSAEDQRNHWGHWGQVESTKMTVQVLKALQQKHQWHCAFKPLVRKPDSNVAVWQPCWSYSLRFFWPCLML